MPLGTAKRKNRADQRSRDSFAKTGMILFSNTVNQMDMIQKPRAAPFSTKKIAPDTRQRLLRMERQARIDLRMKRIMPEKYREKRKYIINLLRKIESRKQPQSV